MHRFIGILCGLVASLALWGCSRCEQGEVYDAASKSCVASRFSVTCDGGSATCSAFRCEDVADCNAQRHAGADVECRAGACVALMGDGGAELGCYESGSVNTLGRVCAVPPPPLYTCPGSSVTCTMRACSTDSQCSFLVSNAACWQGACVLPMEMGNQPLCFEGNRGYPPPCDGGVAPDAGDPDGGHEPDAGTDGGAEADAGSDAGADAGSGDGGTSTSDAGSDAGAFVDGGSDAGQSDAGVSVDLVFFVRGVQRSPDWVAAQDGTGGFAPITVAGGVGRLAVSDLQGRYGLAWACVSPAKPSMGIYSPQVDVRVLLSTLAEQPRLTLSCDEGPSEVQEQTQLTSTGLSGSEFAEHTFGFRGDQAWSSAVVGQGDLVSVARLNTSGDITRALISRDRAMPEDGGTLVDLSAANSTAVSGPVTFRIAGVPTDCAADPRADVDISEEGYDLQLVTSKLTRHRAGYGPSNCSADLSAQLFPGAMLSAADVYVLRAFLRSDVVGATADPDRCVGQVRLFRGLDAGVSIEPIQLGPSEIARTSGESVMEAAGRCELHLAAHALDRFYLGEWRMPPGSQTAAHWRLVATPQRAGATPSFALPSLSAVPGFDASWPVPDCASGWKVSAVRSAASTATSFTAWSWPTGTLGDVALSFSSWRQP